MRPGPVKASRIGTASVVYASFQKIVAPKEWQDRCCPSRAVSSRLSSAVRVIFVRDERCDPDECATLSRSSMGVFLTPPMVKPDSRTLELRANALGPTSDFLASRSIPTRAYISRRRFVIAISISANF